MADNAVSDDDLGDVILEANQLNEDLEEEEAHDNAVAKAPPPAAPRDQWGSKVSYMLTLIGYAVGFGNIWRFPYQVRENGGLVFLIPYCIMLGAVGIPIFFLELSVGQRRRKGVVRAWNEISPLFGGLGICCGWLCFFIGLYYNTLIAYCLSYFFDSFRKPLPWIDCGHVSCDVGTQKECTEELGGRSTKYYWNRNTLGVSTGIHEIGEYNWSLMLYHCMAWGAIWAILAKGTESVGSVVYFTAVFPYIVLISFFIGNCVIEPEKGWFGAYRLVKPDWALLLNPVTWLKAGSQIFFSLGLALGCLVVFASYNPERNNCHRDAVYISLINCGTSVFAALVVFPIIGALGYRKYEECVTEMNTLFSGALQHMNSTKRYDIYFKTNAKTWAEVNNNTPITFRYGYGELKDDAIGDMSSRQDEHIESITSISAMAGDMLKTLRHCSIGREATASGGGTGFVFIGFTEAVLHMPFPNFWSFMFFTMLLTLGIDSGFGTVEGAVAALEDLTGLTRPKATAIICGIMMILACFIFPFGYGVYVLGLLDEWTANWTLLLIALAECIAVSWSYGLAKISYDIRLMTGNKPNLYILICWKYVSPIVIVILLIGSIIQFVLQTIKDKGIKYKVFDPKNEASNDGDLNIDMPGLALGIGFFLMIFCMIWLPIHLCLRKTKYRLITAEAPALFPEDELREERNINVAKEEDQFSSSEKTIMGKQSLLDLQTYRDKRQSQASLQKDKRASGGLSLT